MLSGVASLLFGVAGRGAGRRRGLILYEAERNTFEGWVARYPEESWIDAVDCYCLAMPQTRAELNSDVHRGSEVARVSVSVYRETPSSPWIAYEIEAIEGPYYVY